ncbi:MAG: DNA recombination protein RmuC [Bacteroidales bacterium]|nr:DNA recombination protein RmuC [Bacteroidales bacterium]
MPEAYLAREAEMCYTTCSIVTNMGAGIVDKPIDHMEVLSKMKESIEKMSKAMNDNAIAHNESNTRLSQKLEQAVRDMGEKTADVGAKADELSEALTGRPKMQGNWGENFLDDILSREGLEKGIHYTREDAREDQSRPDFIFHFKEGLDEKDLVVDSKVSLTAFVRYMNAETPEERTLALAEHVKSVKRHIDELAAKDYFKKLDKDKSFTDYVLMFMPIDMAFRAAIDEDPMLWQYAYSKGVLISTEQTIMPFLKILKITWNKFQEDTNVKKVMDAAQEMIDRVGLFYDSYADLGKKLSAVCKEYNSGLIKISESGKSIATSANKVVALGVKRSKGKALEVPDTDRKIYLETALEDNVQ